jgi:hypothetical protein
VEDEIRRAKWIGIAGLALLFSMFYSCSEARYLAFGRSTEASLLKVEPLLEARRRGGSVPMHDVHYQFEDRDGTVRKESQIVPADWTLPIVMQGSGVRGSGRHNSGSVHFRH